MIITDNFLAYKEFFRRRLANYTSMEPDDWRDELLTDWNIQYNELQRLADELEQAVNDALMQV